MCWIPGMKMSAAEAEPPWIGLLRPAHPQTLLVGLHVTWTQEPRGPSSSYCRVREGEAPPLKPAEFLPVLPVPVLGVLILIFPQTESHSSNGR